MKICLTKDDFKFQYDYQSRIYRLLQNIDLSNVAKFEIELEPNQEIDENDFQNYIIYFKGLKNLIKFKIDAKQMNYLTPRSYKQIINCLPQSLNQLEIFVSNKVDSEALTWLSILESVGQRKFKDFKFIVAKLFQISLSNNCFNLRIFDFQSLDQQNYYQVAQFCLNQNFKIFSIAIGNNTRVDQFLNIFDIVFRRKQIEQLFINLGDSTSIQSDGITNMIVSNAFTALQTLNIRIGNQNQIDDKFAESLLLLLPSILQLDLNIGHSNRLLQQLSTQVQPHQLQVLKFTLGRNNNFTKYGFLYLNNLVKSQSLLYLSIDLYETVVQDVSKSFYLISCLSTIRSLQSLKIILDRNFIFDSKTVALLGGVVKNNKNLKQFVFSTKQSQKNYIIMDDMLKLFSKSNIINLEIWFAQCFALQSANTLLELQSCQSLTSLKLIFVNDNGLSDYEICYSFGANICAIQSLTTLHLEFDNQQGTQSEQNTNKMFQNLAEYIMIHRKDLILHFRYQEHIFIKYNILSLEIKFQELNNFENYFPTHSIKIEKTQYNIKPSHIKWIAKACIELDEYKIYFKNFILYKTNDYVQLECSQESLSLFYKMQPKFRICSLTVSDIDIDYVQFYKDLFYFFQNVDTARRSYDVWIKEVPKIDITHENARLELKINRENVSEFELFCRALEQLIPKVEKVTLFLSVRALHQMDWTNFEKAICSSNNLRRLFISIKQSWQFGLQFHQQRQYSVEIFSRIINCYFNILIYQPILCEFDFETLFNLTFPENVDELIREQIKWEHEQQWNDQDLAEIDVDGNIVPNQNQIIRLPQVPGIQNFDQHQHQVVKAQRLALLEATKIKLNKIIKLKKHRSRMLLQIMIAQKRYIDRFKKRRIIQEIINLL